MQILRLLWFIPICVPFVTPTERSEAVQRHDAMLYLTTGFAGMTAPDDVAVAATWQELVKHETLPHSLCTNKTWLQKKGGMCTTTLPLFSFSLCVSVWFWKPSLCLYRMVKTDFRLRSGQKDRVSRMECTKEKTSTYKTLRRCLCVSLDPDGKYSGRRS